MTCMTTWVDQSSSLREDDNMKMKHQLFKTVALAADKPLNS